MTISNTLDQTLLDQAYDSLEDYEDANSTQEFLDAGDSMMAAAEKIISYDTENHTELFNIIENADIAIEDGEAFYIIKSYFDQIYTTLAKTTGYILNEG